METNCILSYDLLVEILLRLTIRQLLQLRCTCKSWCSLIDSVSFINLHYRHQYSICKDEPPLFCVDAGKQLARTKHEKYYRLICDYQWEHVLDLSDGLLGKMPIDAEEPHGYNVRCIGVVNGIVCLQWGDKEIGFWNPATRDFKLIEYYRLNLPRRAIGASLKLIGFGFDIVSNDFKVVGVNRWGRPRSRGDTEKHCKVYSLTANTWKHINAQPAIFLMPPSFQSAFLKGICYWPTVVCSEGGDFRGANMIVSFNFTIEVFEIFDLPKDARLAYNNGWRNDWTVQLFMESIALIISNVNYEVGENIVDIWIATKFDDDSRVPLSWEHLFTIPLTHTFSSTLWVYGSRNHVNLIIQIEDENLEAAYYCSLYNPSTGMFKKLGITIHTCFSFVESLFPLSKKSFKDGARLS